MRDGWLSMSSMARLVLLAAITGVEILIQMTSPGAASPVMVALVSSSNTDQASSPSGRFRYLDPEVPDLVRVVADVGEDRTDVESRLNGHARPTALAVGDLDMDGVTDLIVGFAEGDAGFLALLRGDATAALAPPAERLAGRFEPPEELWLLPEAPNLLGMGDFDRDGHADIVAAAREGRMLHVLSGDGGGGIVADYVVSLTGRLTALAVGDVNRRDGLADLIVGIEGAAPHLLVFESYRGALGAEPEMIDLPAPARTITIGQLDSGYEMDIAVAAGTAVMIVRGRDRRLSGDLETRNTVAPPETVVFELSENVLGVAPLEPREGRAWSDVATLSENGSIAAVVLDDDETRPDSVGDLGSLGERVSPSSALVAARLAVGNGRSLIVVDPGHERLRVLERVETRDGVALTRKGLRVENPPAALLTARLDGDGLDDLVLLLDGEAGPVVLPSAALMTYTVNSTNDPGVGVCDAVECTLREAIVEANALGGADAIEFALGPGTPSIALASPLPPITDTLTIDGGTGGSTRIELNGAGAGAGASGVVLDAGSSGSVLRSLVVNRFAGTGANGIRILSADNVVEDCFVGLDVGGGTSVSGNQTGVLISGAAAIGNIVGGTIVSQRTLVSDNSVGVQVASGASMNRILGSWLGLDSGGASAANAIGVEVRDSSNNQIGSAAAPPGTPPGNVICGPAGSGAGLHEWRIQGVSAGNLVAGNLLGIYPTGTTLCPTPTNGGMWTLSPSHSTTIGGTSNAHRNVIASRMDIRSAGTRVVGNFIGTDITGTAALAAVGIRIQSSAANIEIGAPTSMIGQLGGNLVSGGSSVETGATGALIRGNLIGTDVTGLTRLGGGLIAMLASINPMLSATVGGSSLEDRNVVTGLPFVAPPSTGAGVVVTGGRAVVIAGNYIGTDVTGSVDLNPDGIPGVFFSNSDPASIIGGTTAIPGTPPGNVISGNSYGVRTSGPTTGLIVGNIIGLDAVGGAAVPNQLDGIFGGRTVGGTTPAHRNVISGNGGAGIAVPTLVQGNFIGTDITGTSPIPNQGPGVSHNCAGALGAIGGATMTPGTPPGNVISGNSNRGIVMTCTSTVLGPDTMTLVQGNIIGLDAREQLLSPTPTVCTQLSSIRAAGPSGGFPPSEGPDPARGTSSRGTPATASSSRTPADRAPPHRWLSGT